MALTICPACKNEISSNANSCPKCGYKKSSLGWYIGGVIVVVILAIPVIVGDWGGDSPRSAYSRRRINEQALIAFQIVKTEDFSVRNCKRYNIHVRVGHVLSSNELKTTSNKIITDFKATRPFDALTLRFYLPDSDINGVHTAGMTEYAPYGDWSRAADVRTGEYTHHRLKLSPGNATNYSSSRRVPVQPRKPISQTDRQKTQITEKSMQDSMNSAGFKTYCTIVLNEYGTRDIIFTSGSSKDSISSKAIDDYIGAAVGAVAGLSPNLPWASRNLIIKVGFGRQFVISTSDCRRTAELFRQGGYQQSSDYLFGQLKEVKSK